MQHQSSAVTPFAPVSDVPWLRLDCYQTRAASRYPAAARQRGSLIGLPDVASRSERDRPAARWESCSAVCEAQALPAAVRCPAAVDDEGVAIHEAALGRVCEERDRV